MNQMMVSRTVLYELLCCMLLLSLLQRWLDLVMFFPFPNSFLLSYLFFLSMLFQSVLYLSSCFTSERPCFRKVGSIQTSYQNLFQLIITATPNNANIINFQLYLQISSQLKELGFILDFLKTLNLVIAMQLKRQLLEWYNGQLEDKNVFVSSVEELATGYHFLEVLHNYHQKTVDLSRVYVKPKNQYEVLQNYKYLCTCFVKLGWKKFDPERYSKRRERDYLSMAQTFKKILSSRSFQQNGQHNNFETALEGFGVGEQIKNVSNGLQPRKAKLLELQKVKKELLGKIMRVQQELNGVGEGKDSELIEKMRQRILEIVEDN